MTRLEWTQHLAKTWRVPFVRQKNSPWRYRKLIVNACASTQKIQGSNYEFKSRPQIFWKASRYFYNAIPLETSRFGDECLQSAVWKLGFKVSVLWKIKTVTVYLTILILLPVTIVKLIQQVATWTITIIVKKYVFCSLSDHYSVNIPINPIRRVYELDNEREFRYVRYWKYSYSCVGHTRNSYFSLYRVLHFFSLLHEFFKR